MRSASATIENTARGTTVDQSVVKTFGGTRWRNGFGDRSGGRYRRREYPLAAGDGPSP
ncbi:hypothetical protein [Halomicrobium urmianum]|uniref:hypothetical protein n=1 Tax=Halomicrobium urmianum TaxID=1586233 RepID=UPI001CD9F66E|nr:hypothetical protein [Halomicrobium urmianum]